MELNGPEAAELDAWLAGATLPALRRSVEAAIERRPRRPLTAEEREQLHRQGVSAQNWDDVEVTAGFRADATHNARFEGAARLGDVSIRQATIVDSILGDGVSVLDCGRLERYVLADGAALEGVRRAVTSTGGSPFGQGIRLFEEPLFARSLPLVAELPFDWAAWVTSPQAARRSERPRVERLGAACDAYAALMRAERGFIGPGARVLATPILEDVWIGPCVEIEAATALRGATIWGLPEAPTRLRDGVRVSQAVIGPGCAISNLVSVERSFFFGRAGAEAHAIVKGSAVGPWTRLGECEVNDSFLGPFTTAIHHGLIIAAWWPEGKGNLSYGANVGSNHTGRAPDQEIFPGEGTFFGLGCNLVLPSNFRNAPYLLIASGVRALAQKVEFPFSLMLNPTELNGEVAPGLNELRPGWQLEHNAYGLERHERHWRSVAEPAGPETEPRVFRPEIVGRMLEARRRLEAAAGAPRAVYTESEIAGLGKNFLTEAARAEALAAYDWGARFGAARCLLARLQELAETSSPKTQEVGPELIAWAAALLQREAPEALLEECLKLEREWIERVRASKERDWTRGRRILDDYAERHLPPDHDPLIKSLEADWRRHRDRLAEYGRLLAIPAAARR